MNGAKRAGPAVSAPEATLGWRAAFTRTVMAALLIWAGYWLAITTLQWHVAELPGSTPSTLGWLYFIQLSPLLFLAPLFGRLVDQVGGRPVLIASASLLLLMGALGWHFANTEMLLFGLSAVVSGGLGLCMAAVSPSVHAFVPTIVPGQFLPRAVRVAAIAQNVARLLGPMSAGLLLLAVGVPLSLAAVAAVATVALLLLLPSGGIVARPRRSATDVGGIFSGFVIASRSPLARGVLLLTLANSTLGLSHVAMLPLVANSVLNVGEVGYAAIMTAGGAGALLGALFPFSRLRTLRPVGGLFFGHAAGIALLALAPNLTVAVIASGLLSIIGIMTAVSLNIRLQTGLEPHTRGRLMSLFTWAWGGFLPIGGLLLGGVASATSVPVALLIAAALLTAVGAVTVCTRLGRV